MKHDAAREPNTPPEEDRDVIACAMIQVCERTEPGPERDAALARVLSHGKPPKARRES